MYEQYVFFKEGCQDQLINKNLNTTLTAWFLLNQNDPNARQYLYTDIPYMYVFKEIKKQWTARKRLYKPVLARLYSVNPKDRERFYLRLLLLHVKGARSFEDMRTVDNITYSTFMEAALARGLLKTDQEWDKCLQESTQFHFPNALCNLFAYICVFHNPINARELFDKYKNHFYHPSVTKEIGENSALIINNILTNNGHTLNDFNLPDIIDFSDIEKYKENENLTVTEQSMELNVFHDITLLSNKQREIFITIKESIENIDKNDNHNKCFFIDGPGGSRKSFLLNSLILYLKQSNISVLPVAWTGIAANLLIDGKTSHLAFKFPLDITDIQFNLSMV